MKKQLPGYVYYLNMQIIPRFLHNRFYYKKICRIIKENGAVGLNCHHKNVTKKLIEFIKKNAGGADFFKAHPKIKAFSMSFLEKFLSSTEKPVKFIAR